MAKNTEENVEFDPNAAPQGEAVEGLNYEDAEGFSFNMKEEVASSGYPLIPVGTHDATIEECTYSISQNSGNPMWKVKWAVPVTEQNKAGEEVRKVRKVTSFVVFSPEQRGRAKMFLKRVAPDMAELEDFKPSEQAANLTGLRARVKITHQKGQDDEIRSNVADVLAPADGAGGGNGFNL